VVLVVVLDEGEVVLEDAETHEHLVRVVNLVVILDEALPHLLVGGFRHNAGWGGGRGGHDGK